MTSDKEPLLTRSKIREMKKQEPLVSKLKQKEAEKEYHQEVKKIKQTFSREKKKQKPLKSNRTTQQGQTKRLNDFLIKAIVIVVILLGILFFAVFKL